MTALPVSDLPDDSMSKNLLLWSPEATRLLIKLRGEREDDFSRGIKKMPLWVEISKEMGRHGYDISVERVSKKWHNLMITYMNNKRKKRTSHWEFFDDLEVYYNDANREIPEIDVDALGDEDPYLTPMRFGHLEQNGVEVKPTSKRKRIENGPASASASSSSKNE